MPLMSCSRTEKKKFINYNMKISRKVICDIANKSAGFMTEKDYDG